MNKKAVIAGSGSSPFTDMAALMLAARRLPKRKQNELYVQTLEKMATQRKVHAMIRQSICPTCNGKLTRGKKDKKNEYKRRWSCTTCSIIYTI